MHAHLLLFDVGLQQRAELVPLAVVHQLRGLRRQRGHLQCRCDKGLGYKTDD